jgi:hypothetical protein
MKIESRQDIEDWQLAGLRHLNNGHVTSIKLSGCFGYWNLGFGYYLGFGIWGLRFGILVSFSGK